jgi:peptidoglycan/xylan/chitin deacetylase (PgdA/CDA1 family)
MRAIVAGGHEVGNHSWTERPTWRLAREEFRRDLLRTEAALRAYAPAAPHDVPRFMRPASGWFRRWAPDELRAHGYRLVLGSAYATDTWRPPPAYLRWALTRMARPGAILVMHVGPGRWRTPAVLADVIRGVRAKGLEFATVGELITRGTCGAAISPPAPARPAPAPAPSASPRGRA